MFVYEHILLILMLRAQQVRSGGLYLQRVGVVSKNNDFVLTNLRFNDKNVVGMFDGDIHPRERIIYCGCGESMV